MKNKKQIKTTNECDILKSDKVYITENRQIVDIDLCGWYGNYEPELVIYLDDKHCDDAHDEIYIPMKRFNEFRKIFDNDNTEHSFRWQLRDYNGKYIRLVWEKIPENERHELDDGDTILYAIKHIINDNSVLYMKKESK